jgi:hypothetical protein
MTSLGLVPLDVVKKFSPAVKFHENERLFPCTIEYLLQGATLKYRTWSAYSEISMQLSGQTAMALFNDHIYMAQINFADQFNV